MSQAELNVTTRTRLGKGGNRVLRSQEQAPAVVYGKGMESCAITIDPKTFKKALGKDINTLITLKGDGPFDGKVVIVKEIKKHAIRRNIMHVDFLAIDLTKPVQVMVPLHTVGKSQGEKDGGSLQMIRHELEVTCLPTAIPAVIEIDVTAFKVGTVLHVNDLQLPAGVEAPHDVNFTILTVTAMSAADAAADAEEAQAKA
ncbi:MAG: 50S ribosomal protein L25 [Desulfuromonadales bacterium]|nr:50S ribosomal protein L25 [Desulfuromonadales bacterium]